MAATLWKRSVLGSVSVVVAVWLGNYLMDQVLTSDGKIAADDRVVGSFNAGAAATSVAPSPVMYRKCDVSDRVAFLRQTCRENGWSSSSGIDWQSVKDRMLIVDDKHKIMFCMVPKAATHTVRILLGELAVGTLTPDVLYPLPAYIKYTGFRLLQTLDGDEKKRILQDYYKIITVRHPLDRLRAVHGNKLKNPGELSKQLLARNTAIIDDYLQSGGVSNASFNPLKDALTFEQFVFLVSREFVNGFADEHWLPVDDLCLVCDIRYDAIFRVETLADDLDLLYKYLEGIGERVSDRIVPQNVALNASRPDEKLRITTDVYGVIGPDVMEGLMTLYRKDFVLFGYHWESKKRATCKISTEGRYCC